MHAFGQKSRRVVLAIAVVVVAGSWFVAVSNAAYGPPIAPPANLAPTKSAAVVSTAVNGNVIVRANLADKYTGERFTITINGKLVAHGKVGPNGRFLTEFGADFKRGDIMVIKVNGQTVLTKRG